MSGVFLAFSLLPGLGRASCRWTYVTLWLSGVVADWMFTTGVDMCAHLFIVHRHVNVFARVLHFHVLNFHGLSQLRNYFNSKIFPIYSI